jgi:K+-sensing histidine kinase KdpD
MDQLDDLSHTVELQQQRLENAHVACEHAEATVARLHLLDVLTELLLRDFDFEHALPDLLEGLKRYLFVDNVAVLRLNAQGDELIMDTVRGPEEIVASRVHVPIGQGIAGRIFATNQPLIVEDLSHAEVVNSFLAEHLRSLLGVPLRVGEHVMGVIHVSTIHARVFTEEDTKALQLVADRIALAFERAQLLANEHAARQEAEHLAQKLQSLQAINDVIVQHFAVDELMNNMLTCISNIMHVDNVAILLPVTGANELMLYNVHGPEREVAPLVRVPIGKGVAGTIMATGQSIIIDDLATSNAVNPFLHERLSSLLGVPLQIEDQIIGVLHVSTIFFRAFTAEDRALLQIAADRIAVAIARAQAQQYAEQARAQAEQRAEQLAALNQQMDNFLGIAGHEMRTPLTSILGNVDLLLRRFARDAASTAATTTTQVQAALPLLERIRRQSERLNNLVNDVLDVSRIHSEHLEIHLMRQDVRSVVQEAVEEQRQLHPDRAFTVHISAAPLWAEIDADRIGQVVANFLTNAIKFAPPTQPIQIKVQALDANIIVAVKDHGPGIPPEEQEKIWDRFHRVGTITQNGSYVGLGLGLYICRTIIERHHGLVGVNSQPGKGAEFWFSLPQNA